MNHQIPADRSVILGLPLFVRSRLAINDHSVGIQVRDIRKLIKEIRTFLWLYEPCWLEAKKWSKQLKIVKNTFSVTRDRMALLEVIEYLVRHSEIDESTLSTQAIESVIKRQSMIDCSLQSKIIKAQSELAAFVEDMHEKDFVVFDDKPSLVISKCHAYFSYISNSKIPLESVSSVQYHNFRKEVKRGMHLLKMLKRANEVNPMLDSIELDQLTDGLRRVKALSKTLGLCHDLSNLISLLSTHEQKPPMYTVLLKKAQKALIHKKIEVASLHRDLIAWQDTFYNESEAA